MTKLISSIKKPLALLAAVLLLACMPAAAYAVPEVDTAAQCALTVRCAYASAPLEGVSVRVYRAADVDANMRFTLAPAFADSGVDLAAMTGAAQWSSAAAALAKYAQETKLTPEYSGKTDASGAPLMILSRETRVENNEYMYSYVLACGSADYNNSEYLNAKSYANRDILYSAMRITGRERVLADIEPKVLDDTSIDITTAQANNWTVALATVLPVVIIACGAVVWVRRKNS